MTTRLTIVVNAMLADVPGQGGWAWVVLQYVLGFKRLGHRVLLLDQLSDKLGIDESNFKESVNAQYFQSIIEQYELTEHAALTLDKSSMTVGVAYDDLIDIIKSADLLLNVSGRRQNIDEMSRVPIRVYLDLDPTFTQLWQSAHGIDMNLSGHTHHVTVGPAIGQPGCDIPTCGLEWISTNQPIVLEHWPVGEEVGYNGLTTIANWRGYGSAEYRGVFYGQKAHSLRQFIDLPRRTSEPFILALGIHPDEKEDLAALHRNGWNLIDPIAVAGRPSDYQQFVRKSKAEFGIAKSGYVLSQCGWFSDRSVCYLASGRPVIAQDTGFGNFLPTNEGLFSFRTADDVVRAIDLLNADYAYHCRAARRIAEEHFDSDMVLNTLLQRVGAL